MTAAALSDDVVRSFAVVVLRCLRETVGVDAVIEAVGAPDPAIPSIAVALDLAGDVRGPVTWVFPAEIALELVRRLLDDPSPSQDTLADGATELANILTGHAADALEEHGFRCNLGVPRVHAGGVPPGIEVRMGTPAGPIDLVLSLSRA